MTIKVYTGFSKRRNSTKQPTGGTQKTVTLKEGTSVEKPTFLLNGSDFTIDYVSAFNNYYWVDDVVAVRNNLTEIKCSMDSLATHKTAIGSYQAMIERCNTTGIYDQWLSDPATIMTGYENIDSNTVASMFDSGHGTFALSVLNTKGSGAGFTTVYLLDYTNIELISQYCNTNWGSAVGPLDIVEWLQATFLKTANSIIDCVWLPISYSTISGLSDVAYENVEIGVDAISGCNGYRMTGPVVMSSTVTIDMPVHYYSDFRTWAPYTTYKLYIPGYGMTDVNGADFSANKIEIVTDVDLATGDTTVYLQDYTTHKVVATHHYNVGVSCPVGKVGSDVTGTIGGILTTASNIATSKIPGNRYADIAKIDAIGAGINALATASAITPSSTGSRGGRSLIKHGLNFICTMFARNTIDPADYAATNGLLTMSKHSISSCSGYVKCINASVPIAGMAAERDEVNSFLNNGFYYE